MMHDLKNRFPSEPQDETGQPVMVSFESPAFEQFDQLMDAELERLVQRWVHTAAPNASRSQLGRARFAP